MAGRPTSRGYDETLADAIRQWADSGSDQFLGPPLHDDRYN